MSRRTRRTRGAATTTPPRRLGALDRPLVVGAVPGLVALALYLSTAARDIVVGDPTDYVIVSLTGGVAHPPGYPLLTMLGRALASLPVDTPELRVSLLSVLSGAGSVALVAITALRLGASGPAAMIGSLIFAASALVWRWSVVPEAFALNDLLVAGIVLALVSWRAHPRSALPVVAGSFLGGLALAHHQTAALIAPAVAIALWQGRASLRARPACIAFGAAALLVGLAPYAYVPITSATDPAWNWGRVSSAGDLWSLVTRQGYGTTQLVSEAGVTGGSPFARVGLLLGSYWPLEVIALIGAAFAFTRQRWYFWRTAAAFALAGPLFVAYANLDPSGAVNRVVLERFFLLPHVLTAPLLGLALSGAAEHAASLTAWRLTRPVVLSVALIATVVVAIPTYPAVDRREDHLARGYALDILASVEPDTILLTAGDDSSTGVAYLRLVEKERPDVIHVMAPLLRAEWYVRELRARLPGLVVPFIALGAGGTLRQLVEANPGREFAVVGGLVDNSLKDTHWLYTRGLVSILKRLPESGTIDDLAQENDRLLSRYHVPAQAAVRGRPWEQAILSDYARPAFLVGQQYEIAKLYPEARRWFQRTLAIDPQHARSREALKRLPKS